jgi:hypothetical protein
VGDNLGISLQREMPMRYLYLILGVLLVAGLALIFHPGGAKAAEATGVSIVPPIGAHVDVEIDRPGDHNGQTVGVEGKLLAMTDSWIVVENGNGTYYLATQKVAIVQIKS